MSKALKKIASNLGLDVLPDNATHRYRMEIRSETSDRIYVIAQSKSSGDWECSCPGWVFKRGDRRDCKHLRAVVPTLEQTLKKIG